MKTIKIACRKLSFARHGGRLGLAACALLGALGFALSAPAGTRYVNVNNPTPESPYDSFPKAATNIQDAIFVAFYGDLILVTNGVYRTGGAAYGSGYLWNRVPVWKPVTVRSINGPQVTVIEGHQAPGVTNGDGAIRCTYRTKIALTGACASRMREWK